MVAHFSNGLGLKLGQPAARRAPRRAYQLIHSCCAVIATALVTMLTLASPAVAAGRGTVECGIVERGTIEGRVTDPAGAQVSGARVALLDQSGSIAYQTRTDADGQFKITGVTEGRYAVAVEAQGFAQIGEIAVEVRSGVTAAVAVSLKIAAIADAVVVTATRTAAPLDELGGSVSVISREQLTRANQTLVAEPLRLIPGLTVVQSGGRGGITSIFTRGGESDYNKVLIDGVPVNAAGGLFDFASLMPENLDRIEVVRGPQSALFGSDAMTSVIQLFTARGTTAVPEFELTGEGGNFDFHRETARLAGASRWFDYAASVGFQATDGRFRNSDFINRSASANLGFHLTPSADLRLTSRLNNNTLGVAGPTAILFADPDERQKHHDLAAAGTFDWRTTARLHQTARFIYSEFQTHNFDPVAQDLTQPDTPPVPFTFVDFAFTFRDHEKRAGAQYQVIATLGRANVFTGGIDYEHESAVFDDGFSRVSPARNNFGVYVQDQAAWRERLFVTAGVRVERNAGDVPADLRAALALLGSTAPIGDVGFGVQANPKIAASVLARRHQEGAAVGATRLKASFGTGIKEPSLTEAFSPSVFFLGNPSLDPERVKSFEVGLSQEFADRRASLEVTYFDNRFRDQIAFVSDPVTFGPVQLEDGRLTNFINVERATARGVELTAAARPVRRFRVGGSYTFLRSQLARAASALNPQIGLPLLRRPRHSGTIEAGWVAERFDLTLDGSFLSRRRDFDPVTGARFDAAGRVIFNDGYAKLNLAGAFHLTRAVTAFARTENLLNQDYQEAFGYPAYRLNFSAGLRVRVGGRQ